jgi:Rieske 2Fe-2S family protein
MGPTNVPITEFSRPKVGGAACTLEGRHYVSDHVFQAEAERIFARHWLAIGRANQIRDNGEYVLVQLGDESLIVLRDHDGRARAHYNVCRHRGTRLCESQRGKLSESIQCKYHAWTYALDGRLIAARLMHEVPGFCNDDYPLKSARVAEWEGFLFLNLADDAAAFDETFAALAGKFAAWNLANLQVARRIAYDVRANWKQLIENYSECYHCPLIHPALDRLSPSTSGRNDQSSGLVLGGYMTLNESAESLTTSGQTGRPPLGTVGGADLARVYYYSMFPNMLLSLHPDYVMVHTLWPLAAGLTRVDCEWLFEPATMARPDFDASDAVDFWDATNRQDWHACELSHLGLRSRSYTPGPYAHSEGLLDAFDREYLRIMDEA